MSYHSHALLFLLSPFVALAILAGVPKLLKALHDWALEKLRSLESQDSFPTSLIITTKISEEITLSGVKSVKKTDTLRVDQNYEFDVTNAIDAYKNPEAGGVNATFAWTVDSAGAALGALSLLDASTLKIGFKPNGGLGTALLTGVPTVVGDNPSGFQPANIEITLNLTAGLPVDFSGTATITDSGVDSTVAAPSAAPTPAPAAPTPSPAPSAPTDGSGSDTSGSSDTSAPAPAPTAPTDGGDASTSSPAPAPSTGGDTSDSSASGDAGSTSGTTDSTGGAAVGGDASTSTDTSAPAPAVAPVDSAQPVATPTAPVNASPDASSTQ